MTAAQVVFLIVVTFTCLFAAAVSVGRALGARSLDYPELPVRRRRSNYARTAGGHNDLRKVRG